MITIIKSLPMLCAVNWQDNRVIHRNTALLSLTLSDKNFGNFVWWNFFVGFFPHTLYYYILVKKTCTQRKGMKRSARCPCQKLNELLSRETKECGSLQQFLSNDVIFYSSCIKIEKKRLFYAFLEKVSSITSPSLNIFKKMREKVNLK